ncbi:hypothetical protein IE53DRAFT_236206 [Violaceomyces palustris]|uniref:Uncharacterized protein n=1 Tax=Violaceomyces palustris TaxID=1673888 RepID=A0ACD0NPF6_9BASI|nr:hypothetical protein IE53DRAFT_236206 [Violaceomyces palustris]
MSMKLGQELNPSPPCWSLSCLFLCRASPYPLSISPSLLASVRKRKGSWANKGMLTFVWIALLPFHFFLSSPPPWRERERGRGGGKVGRANLDRSCKTIIPTSLRSKGRGGGICSAYAFHLSILPSPTNGFPFPCLKTSGQTPPAAHGCSQRSSASTIVTFFVGEEGLCFNFWI